MRKIEARVLIKHPVGKVLPRDVLNARAISGQDDLYRKEKVMTGLVSLPPKNSQNLRDLFSCYTLRKAVYLLETITKNSREIFVNM